MSVFSDPLFLLGQGVKKISILSMLLKIIQSLHCKSDLEIIKGQKIVILSCEQKQCILVPFSQNH